MVGKIAVSLQDQNISESEVIKLLESLPKDSLVKKALEVNHILHLAAQANYVKLAGLLVRINEGYQVNPNRVDAARQLPLHYAASNLSPELCKLLLGKKWAYLVNHPNPQANTPIHLAVLAGSKDKNFNEVISILTKAGADINKPNSEGKSALELVESKELKQFLEDKSKVYKSRRETKEGLRSSKRESSEESIVKEIGYIVGNLLNPSTTFHNLENGVAALLQIFKEKNFHAGLLDEKLELTHSFGARENSEITIRQLPNFLSENSSDTPNNRRLISSIQSAIENSPKKPSYEMEKINTNSQEPKNNQGPKFRNRTIYLPGLSETSTETPSQGPSAARVSSLSKQSSNSYNK